MVRGPYLKIDRITSVEPIRDLSNSIAGVAIKNVEVGNSLLVEERTGYAAMESNVCVSASR